MSHYLSPELLRSAVLSSQQEGRVNNEFAECLILMVRNICTKYGGEAEDLYSQIFLVVTRLLHRLNPDKPVFSYLTTVICNEIRKQYRDKVRESTLIERVRNKAKQTRD